jgi:uncharacterized protein YhhL (DUF1145 family)
MAEIVIGILWFLVFLVILAGVIYLAIWVIENFVHPIPERIKQGVWVVVLLIALIYLITILIGGGGMPTLPKLR